MRRSQQDLGEYSRWDICLSREAAAYIMLRHIALVRSPDIVGCVSVEDQLATCGDEVDTPPRSLEHPIYTVGLKTVILMEKLDPFASRQCNGSIPILNETEIPSVFEHANAFILDRIAPRNRHGIVTAAIVDHENFDIGK
jgi:hypothetical protein